MSVLFYGTPEYEAYQATQAPYRAAAEAKRVAREAERAEREQKAAPLRAALEKYNRRLERLRDEAAASYKTIQEAAEKCTQTENKAISDVARWKEGTLSKAAAARSADLAEAATDAHNALVPAHNSIVARHEVMKENIQKVTAELAALAQDPR
jgi:hypothetical protein